MADMFDAYLHKLRQTPLGEQTAEPTGRYRVGSLLNECAAAAGHAARLIQHEPKRVAEKGAPDFKIAERA